MKRPFSDLLIEAALCLFVAALVLVLNSALDREMEAEQATSDTVHDRAVEQKQLEADWKFAEARP